MWIFILLVLTFLSGYYAITHLSPVMNTISKRIEVDCLSETLVNKRDNQSL
jgi:hypothetical protein